MKKNTIIFDLDGTLLNTLEDLKDSTNYALSCFGFPSRTLEEIRNFVGNGVAKLIERAIPDGKNNPSYPKCLETFKENYALNMYNKTAPYPGITDMLSHLKFENYKIAVVSNKFDAAVKHLCSKYFPDLVDLAIGENEAAGIHKKPAPDSVLKVLSEFGADKNQAVYVGDSEVDIQTAKNSGLPCISVSWGFKYRDFLLANGAKIIINSPEEIMKYL